MPKYLNQSYDWQFLSDFLCSEANLTQYAIFIFAFSRCIYQAVQFPNCNCTQGTWNSVMQILIQKLFCYICSSGSLVVKGPSEPVLEGEDVTLECVDTESELNMSSVHFERLSKVKSFTKHNKICPFSSAVVSTFQ